MATSHSDRKAVLDSLLLGIPGVTGGRMFGYRAYYARGKLFACICGDGLGIKVPEEIAKKLLSGRRAVPFRPMGKPQMREWVQIDRARPADYRKDIDVLRASVRFVRRLQVTRRVKT